MTIFDPNSKLDSNISRYLDYSMTITRMITEKMREEGITIKQLARMLNRRESQVDDWLSGRQNFTLRMLADISVVLELDFSEAFKNET